MTKVETKEGYKDPANTGPHEFVLVPIHTNKLKSATLNYLLNLAV